MRGCGLNRRNEASRVWASGVLAGRISIWRRHIRWPGAVGRRQDNLQSEAVTLKYSEMEEIEPGLKFKTRSGLMVETTGVTVFVEATEVQVHEVVITDGVGEGNKYLHNLDSAEPVE